MYESKTKRTIVGIIWSAIERFSVQIIQFIVSIILARLLFPEDFGIIAIVNLLLAVFQTINEAGFSVALIHKLNRDDLDYSTTFIFNIFLGVILYIITFLIAPILAQFFNEEQLLVVTRLVCLNLIINSFIVVQRTILTLKMDFKTQAKASFISVVISGSIGIYCAFNDFGIMSLVYQSLLYSTTNALMIWYYSKWIPHTFFSFQRFQVLFNYAYKLTLARLIDVIYQNAYSFIIGKFYSPVQLGFYTKANSFQMLPSNNIAGIIQKVSTPVLCESQNDHEQLRKDFRKFLVSSCMIVFPIMAGMAVLAYPLIIVLLKEKWLPTAEMLKLLSPVGALYIMNTFNRNIFNAVGRTDIVLKLEVYKKIIYVTFIIIAIRWGITALLWVQILNSLIELFINTHYTKKLIDFGLIKQLKALKHVLLSCFIMTFAIYIIISFFDDYMIKLVIGTTSGIVIYTLMCYFFNIENLKKYLFKIT